MTAPAVGGSGHSAESLDQWEATLRRRGEAAALLGYGPEGWPQCPADWENLGVDVTPRRADVYPQDIPNEGWVCEFCQDLGCRYCHPDWYADRG